MNRSSHFNSCFLTNAELKNTGPCCYRTRSVATAFIAPYLFGSLSTVARLVL